MSAVLEIPDAAVAEMRLALDELREELRRDLAVVLYARGALPISNAMEFAGLNQREFGGLLKERKARRPFDEAELRR